MRASLEARVPFLDKGLAEFALRLPADLKIRGFKGKYVLRKLAEKYLPREIVRRRKHGFVVPWEEWVRRPDSKRIDELISDSSASVNGVFDRHAMVAARRALAAGDKNTDAGLFFRVVMLALWSRSLKT